MEQYHGKRLIDKREVARKLRLFGKENYGTMKNLALALGMTPGTLYSGYLNSRSVPGPEMLLRLMNLGCDIRWLLTRDASELSMAEDVRRAS